MARRIIAAGVFAALGLGLLGSQLPLTADRAALGVGLLAIWGGSGLAIILRPSVGRALGGLVAVAGMVAGGVAAALANEGQATLVAETFFLPDGPTFSWIEVFFGAAAFAVLSVLGGLLVLMPFAGKVGGSAPSGPVEQPEV